MRNPYQKAKPGRVCQLRGCNAAAAILRRERHNLCYRHLDNYAGPFDRKPNRKVPVGGDAMWRRVPGGMTQ